MQQDANGKQCKQKAWRSARRAQNTETGVDGGDAPQMCPLLLPAPFTAGFRHASTQSRPQSSFRLPKRDNLGRARDFRCAVRSNPQYHAGFQPSLDFTGFPTLTFPSLPAAHRTAFPPGRAAPSPGRHGKNGRAYPFQKWTERGLMASKCTSPGHTFRRLRVSVELGPELAQASVFYGVADRLCGSPRLRQSLVSGMSEAAPLRPGPDG